MWRERPAFSEAEPFLGDAEAGFTPAEALGDATGGARTPITPSAKRAGGCLRDRYPPGIP
jgi:hypothetical protein